MEKTKQHLPDLPGFGMIRKVIHMLHIENLQLQYILYGNSVVHKKSSARPTHGFIFKICGQSRYDFPEGSLTLGQGQMLYIPKGTIYSVTALTEDPGQFVLLNFLGDVSDSGPAVYQLDDRMDFGYLCNRLCKYRIEDTKAGRYRCTALFYEVLAHIWEIDSGEYMASLALHRLDPAVEHLNESLFDPNLRISQLHTLCNISDTYFRKLFAIRFGLSPKQYVLNKRLSHARDLLHSGEYNSIRDVARMSGFDDSLYFSKLFRRNYGHAPSEETVLSSK